MTLRVLLVEDDPALRITLRDALAVKGHTVLAAASLADGQALAAHAAPDLVLLDLGLPDGDGQTLLLRLRQRSNTPVILISARHGETQKIALLDAGADNYLVKPFRVGELLARLVRNAGQVVTHRQLLGDVWGADCTEHTQYLRRYVGQLRIKLEADPADPQRWLTEPGVGYRLVEGDGAVVD